MKRPLLLGSGLFAAALLLAGPAPTATPRPQLTGGFGRGAATPAARGKTGQSLADVVRAASEGRKKGTTPKPVISITNKSLVKDQNRGRLTTWQVTPAPSGKTAARTPEAVRKEPASGQTPGEGALAAQESKWREIAQQTRRRVADLEQRVAALQAESKKLENDFYRWDDGQYRDSVIKPAWDKKREELETARRQLAEARKELADLPEKARKAGALPGWIRE